MAVGIIWDAQPRQSVFLNRTEEEVLFGGSAGGGKTDGLLAFIIRRAVVYSYSKHLFLRRTFADLSKAGAAIDRSKELLSSSAHWDDQKHRWTFSNGSVFEFGYLDREDDKYNYQGAQFDSLAFDEAGLFTGTQYLYMISRCRSTVAGIIPLIRLGSNPGGVGHAFLKARFITPASPETTFEIPKEPGQTRQRFGCFIPSRLSDNQILIQRDPGYWDRLMSLPEDERRALAYGDWDVFAGQYFKEWRYNKHVIDPFDIPRHWRKWGGLDWGFAKPLSFGVYTQDPDTDRIYRVRELYRSEMRDSEAIELIKATIAGDTLDAIYADPSMWQRKSSDDSLSTAERYTNANLMLIPANNDRLQGWRRVRDLLADGKDELPMFQVFSNCRAFIKTFPNLIYDHNRAEDLDTDTEDHAADECRYALISRMSTNRKTDVIVRKKSAWEYL